MQGKATQHVKQQNARQAKIGQLNQLAKCSAKKKNQKTKRRNKKRKNCGLAANAAALIYDDI